MALKKKPKVDEPVETGSMTEDEAVALAKDETKRFDASASMERLQLATRIVSEKFGLDDEYHVTKFNDKGKVVDITLEGAEFILSCTIKNSENQGMYTPD